MIIRNKETLFVLSSGIEHTIKPSTIGVVKGSIVYFYDTTKTVAIGFEKNHCLESKEFSVQRTIEDREVSINDIVGLIKSSTLSVNDKEQIIMKVQSL